MEMETTQIKGVDSTIRDTQADLKDGASLVIKEKIMTHGNQTAETNFVVNLDGVDSSANVISRSVAKDSSKQVFNSKYAVTTSVTDILNVMQFLWITDMSMRCLRLRQMTLMQVLSMRRQSAR